MERTAEEAEANYRVAMGDELGTLFSALWQELVSAHLCWEQFSELFGSGQSRIEILNKSAPRFFQITQQLLWSEALLNISRLTAPVESRGKPNLTIRRLPLLVDSDDLMQIVKQKVDLAVQFAAFAHDWRNRRLAHRDLLLALRQPTEPLTPATREAVERCLATIADVMKIVESYYTNRTTEYSHVISQGGARALLYCLRDGLRRDEDRREATRKGAYDPRLYNDDLGTV